ncbi:MAG TPA: HK97 family phage prohead protease [Steroidobacteraceae bacterium]|nr:HK97 family phage prohead protease [Steroidobacteraceae bacterium]
MTQQYLSTKLANVQTNAEQRTFEGLASVFNNLDLGGDVVMPGAFAKSLAAHRANGTAPAMFFMHDAAKIPGRWIDMAETREGLAVKGRLSNTPLGNEMYELLKDGSISGLSIGYVPAEAGFDREGNRVLKAVDLFEISLVPLPMNVRAQVTPGSVKDADPLNITQFERLSRATFGMSRAGATRFASRAWKLYRATQTGAPLEESALDEIKNSLESAAVLALIQHQTDRMRNL